MSYTIINKKRRKGMRIKKEELAKMIGCSPATASKLITKMNQELKEQGYLTIRGTIPKQYAVKRLFIEETQHDEVR